MSTLNDPRASVKALLLSLTKTQREQLDLIEALANALPETGPDGDEMLDVDQAHAEFGVARKGLKRAADRGELALSRGTRGKLLISRAELRRWLDSRPYKATRKAAPPAEDFDALDAELRRGGLVRSVR